MRDLQRWSNLRDRALPILTVSDIYGETVRRNGRGYRGRCPFHDGGNPQAFYVDPSEKWFYCHTCKVSGTAIDYVMKTKGIDAFHDAVVHLARLAGLGDGTDGAARSPHVGGSQPVARHAPSKRTEQPPNYPPIDEVRELWRIAYGVRAYPLAAHYLSASKKRLDPELIARFDSRPTGDAVEPNYGLLRVLPVLAKEDRFDWMRWWWWAGYRLIAPLVDAQGQVRSFQARNVLAEDERPPGPNGDPRPKSISVGGFEKRGLLLACPRARHVLMTGALPVDWPMGEQPRFEVCEGELKYTLRACKQYGNPRGAMVFGVVGGAWTKELVARLPDRSRVWIGTDENPGGTAHATTILRALQFARGRGIEVSLRREFELDPTAKDKTVRLTAAAQTRYEAWKRARDAAKKAQGTS
ncbi:MAG: primase [Pseudomonadota bacterium]|jgi:hypothetical protein